MLPLHFPPVLDSTMLASLRACHHQFELAHLRSYTPLGGKGVHLHAGAAFAHGLEVARKSFYALGCTPGDSVAAGITALVEAYGDYDPGDSPKSLARMCGALEFYLSEFPLDADPARVVTLATGPAVEFSFAIPLPLNNPDTGEPLLFAGKFDAIVEFAGGWYAMDEKTTSSLGATWSRQWDLRGQFCGYAWAMLQHGLQCAGTIVSGVSILKTKYEQQRAIVQQPLWKIDEWYRDTLAEIKEAIERYNNLSRWRKNWSESCNSYGGCSFKQVCTLQDPDQWLDTYYERNEWSPIQIVTA